MKKLAIITLLFILSLQIKGMEYGSEEQSRRDSTNSSLTDHTKWQNEFGDFSVQTHTDWENLSTIEDIDTIWNTFAELGSPEKTSLSSQEKKRAQFLKELDSLMEELAEKPVYQKSELKQNTLRRVKSVDSLSLSKTTSDPKRSKTPEPERPRLSEIRTPSFFKKMLGRKTSNRPEFQETQAITINPLQGNQEILAKAIVYRYKQQERSLQRSKSQEGKK